MSKKAVVVEINPEDLALAERMMPLADSASQQILASSAIFAMMKDNVSGEDCTGFYKRTGRKR